MRKSVVIVSGVLAAAVLFCVALANMHYISPARLAVKFDGKAAANVTLILPTSGSGQYKLDDDGSLTSPNPGAEFAILVPRPKGGAVSLRFPKHGTKIVDIRDQMTTTTIVQYFGLVNSRIEQFSLTQEQVAEIESGQRRLADIEDQIRKSDQPDTRSVGQSKEAETKANLRAFGNG